MPGQARSDRGDKQTDRQEALQRKRAIDGAMREGGGREWSPVTQKEYPKTAGKPGFGILNFEWHPCKYGEIDRG